MVVGNVSTLIGNSRVEVIYSGLWVPCTKYNWTWGEAEVNFWTSISSDRVITFCLGKPAVCRPSILIMFSLDIVMRILDNCSVTIDLDPSA